MVNSAKTPSGKTRKGQVTVRPDSGSIKACFPRSYFADGKQVKLGTGINPDNWEEVANRLQRRLQLELEEGKLTAEGDVFNLGRYQEILEEYGLRAKLRIVKAVDSLNNDQLPPKPELSLLEIWERYREYIKPSLKETTYAKAFCETYTNFINSAIEATKSEDALKIRNWLIENRNLINVKKVLSHLSKAHILLMRQGLIKYNPYDGLADEVKIKGAKGKKQNEIEMDNDVLDKTKAYAWDEVQTILEYAKDNFNGSHWYNFYKFKFLTGVRTGEAIAFMWGDVLWDKEQILIRRTYDRHTKGFYPVKTAKGDKELIRIFPMPKDSELWQLLKSIKQGENNEIVFKSKTGKIILSTTAHAIWSGQSGHKGIIPELIKQGKISKYLRPYNTRHTFITHAIFDLGIPKEIVSAWCGHSEDVSSKHYQDVVSRSLQVNPEIPFSQMVETKSKVETLEEQLAQQAELIRQLQEQLKQR